MSQYIAYAAAAVLGLSAVPWSSIWSKITTGLSSPKTPPAADPSLTMSLQQAHLVLRAALTAPDDKHALDGLYSKALDLQEPAK